MSDVFCGKDQERASPSPKHSCTETTSKSIFSLSLPSFLPPSRPLPLSCCSVVRKMAQYMADLLGDEVKERLAENLLVGPNKLHMENFLTRFQWDGAKFPLRQPLPNIVDGISKVCTCIAPYCASCLTALHLCVQLVSQIDTDLKQKSQAYNILRQNLQAIERKET